MGIIVYSTLWYPMLKSTFVAPVKEQQKKSKYYFDITVRETEEYITSRWPGSRTWIQGVVESIIVEIKLGPTINSQSKPEYARFLPVTQRDTIRSIDRSDTSIALIKVMRS
jgi:hypothetical protein